MNHIRHLAFQTCLLFIAINSNCQVDMFLDITGKYVFINDQETVENGIRIQEYYTPRHPNLESTIGVQKELSKLSFQSGLGLSYLTYNKVSHYSVWFGGIEKNTSISQNDISGFGDFRFSGNEGHMSREIISNGDLNKVGDTRLLYANIPLSVDYIFLKDKFKAGFEVSASYLVYSEQYIKVLDKNLPGFYEEQLSHQDLNLIWTPEEGSVDNNTIYTKYSIVKDKSGNGINKLLICSNIHLQYNIISMLWVKLAYQRSLTPIYGDYNFLSGKSSFHCFNLGFRYYIR